MRKISKIDRLLLLLTALLAAYQVVRGVEGMAAYAVAAYTVGFGVLVVAGLLLLILGFDALSSPLVVIASTLIPLSLSLGLVTQHMEAYTAPYTVFAGAGLVGIALTRFITPGKFAVVVLAAVHGISGLLIFILPFVLLLQGTVPAGFGLVGVGGGLIGLEGLLLSFLKTGKPILSQERILSIFPLLLLAATAAFVIGFNFG